MNKSILLSILSIFAVVGLVGGLTYAYFSDTGTSSGNTFSTGTLDLRLSDSSEPASENVTASFGGSLVPGSCTGNQTLNLQNVGSIAANHAEVHLANTTTDVGENAEPDMDSFLRIDTLQYDAGNVGSQIVNTNANGFIDLEDWAAPANAGALDNLSLTDLGGSGHNLVMNVCLDSSAGNTLQGDSVSSTFTVELNQDASQ